jgi:asparagine synthase (glutamine-hydrolysing)
MNLSDLGAPTLEEISVMISPLRHRGPDQSGVYLDDQVALGNLRLSIIGLADGIQPISNEDGTLWIVYNGEAFNYLELKADLVGRGHHFGTSTDTEVLLHLYEEYGVDALQMINGQFALAIWDARQRELFIARDRVGVRPLYYAQAQGRFHFASEVKALLALGLHRELDLTALAQLFVFWSALPGGTSFKGIRELPAGHYLQVKDGQCITRAYWEIPYYPHPRQAVSLEEAAEQLRELLADAVRLRLRADVPVGAYLSGGLDSSIITAMILSLIHI